MKKYMAIGIIIIMVLSMVSCGSGSSVKMSEKTVKVLVFNHETERNSNDKEAASMVKDFLKQVSGRVGVRYELEVIETDDSYMINSIDSDLLSQYDYDIAVLYTPGYNYEGYKGIKENVALNVQSSIIDQGSMFSGLSDGYYVPFAIAVNSLGYNKAYFDKNNLDLPNAKGSNEETIQLIFDSTINEDVYLNWSSFDYLVNLFFEKEIDLLSNGDLDFEDENLYVKINQTADRLRTSFAFKESYEFFRQYNTLMEFRSTESKQALGYAKVTPEKYILPPYPILSMTNLLNSFDMDSEVFSELIFQGGQGASYISSFGFVINKDSDAIEESETLVKGFLTPEIQKQVYYYYGNLHDKKSTRAMSGVVIKNMESILYGNDYDKMSYSIKLIDTLYKEIETGELSLYSYVDYDMMNELKAIIIEKMFKTEE